MSKRHKAREVVLQMLYQKDLNADTDTATVRTMIEQELREPGLVQFAWSLYAGVMEHRAAIDTQLADVAEKWTLSRMAPTDRNALRPGVYELCYTDTPHRVVIDEALELAKSFGGPQSAAFVNGLLDRLIPSEKRGRRNDGEPPASSSAAVEPVSEPAAESAAESDRAADATATGNSDSQPAGDDQSP